jgi:hypothetical protein
MGMKRAMNYVFEFSEIPSHWQGKIIYAPMTQRYVHLRTRRDHLPMIYWKMIIRFA